MAIARIWRGTVPTARADEYTEYLQQTGIKDILGTPGNLGVWLLRQTHNGRTEFALLTLWDRRESIEAFAGKRIELARYYDEDKDYLLDFRKTVEHFDVAGIWNETPSLPQAA